MSAATSAPLNAAPPSIAAIPADDMAFMIASMRPDIVLSCFCNSVAFAIVSVPPLNVVVLPSNSTVVPSTSILAVLSLISTVTLSVVSVTLLSSTTVSVSPTVTITFSTSVVSSTTATAADRKPTTTLDPSTGIATTPTSCDWSACRFTPTRGALSSMGEQSIVRASSSTESTVQILQYSSAPPCAIIRIARDIFVIPPLVPLMLFPAEIRPFRRLSRSSALGTLPLRSSSILMPTTSRQSTSGAPNVEKLPVSPLRFNRSSSCSPHAFASASVLL